MGFICEHADQQNCCSGAHSEILKPPRHLEGYQPKARLHEYLKTCRRHEGHNHDLVVNVGECESLCIAAAH